MIVQKINYEIRKRFLKTVSTNKDYLPKSFYYSCNFKHLYILKTLIQLQLFQPTFKSL